jgi:hypothetical protein
LPARSETVENEPLKFGETVGTYLTATPSQAR